MNSWRNHRPEPRNQSEEAKKSPAHRSSWRCSLGRYSGGKVPACCGWRDRPGTYGCSREAAPGNRRKPFKSDPPMPWWPGPSPGPGSRVRRFFGRFDFFRSCCNLAGVLPPGYSWGALWSRGLNLLIRLQRIAWSLGRYYHWNGVGNWSLRGPPCQDSRCLQGPTHPSLHL